MVIIETACERALPRTTGPVIHPYDFDDDLLEATSLDGVSRMRVYRPSGPMVVLGRSSRPDEELHINRVLADDIPIHRRRGGGCAVVLDRGCVVVALSLPTGGPGASMDPIDVYARVSEWMIDGLARLGIDGIRREGFSDLVLGDRKIAGACLYRSRRVHLYTACLLLEPPIRLMEAYLAHPPREPAYRRGRGHADFIGSLCGPISAVSDPIESRV